MTVLDDRSGPQPGYVRLGAFDVTALAHGELLEEAEARGIPPLDLVAEILALWALRRRQRRAEHGHAPEEEPQG